MAPSARWVSIDTARNAGPANASADAAKTRQSGLPLSRASAADFEREPRAVEADQAIGELVLHRLELADELAELLSDLGVLDGQLERALAPRRARGRRRRASPPARCRRAFRPACPARTAGVSSKVSSRERRHREAGRGLHRQSRRAALRPPRRRGRVGEDEKMRRRLRAFDKRQLSRQRVAAHLDAARGRDRRRTRRAPAQPSPCPGAGLQQRARRVRTGGWQARDWPPRRRAAAPGTTRGRVPRTPARFRASRLRWNRSRARQGPGRASRATAR